MKSKTFLTTVLSLISGVSVLAYMGIEFPGWDRLQDISTDIFVARCSETPDPDNMTHYGHRVDFQGLYYANVEIISVLKSGTNWTTTMVCPPKPGLARIQTAYCPQQGEYYLIFANPETDYYTRRQATNYWDATESFRFVPLGAHFSTNAIAGHPLNIQMQTLFKASAFHLEKQIQREQAQKQRIESGIQPQSTQMPQPKQNERASTN